MPNDHTVYTALAKRYPAPAYALFYEVGNSTGHAYSNSADAIAMSLWPSRGLDIYGFEIKSDRGDWLRELKNPAKAEAIAQYCTFWWLVDCAVLPHQTQPLLSTDGCIKRDEVPPAWGLLRFTGTKFKVVKEAVARKPKPLTRQFVAAILRRAHAMAISKLTAMATVAGAKAEIIEQAKREVQWDHDEALRDAKDNKAAIAAFQKASGLDITAHWDAGQLGEAVKYVISHPGLLAEGSRLRQAANELQRLADMAKGDADAVEKVIAIMEGKPSAATAAGSH